MKESVKKVIPNLNQDSLSTLEPELHQAKGVNLESQSISQGSANRWFIWTAAFVFAATVSAALGATFALVSPLSPIVAALTQKGEVLLADATSKAKFGWGDSFDYGLARPVNVLVMGIDRVLDATPNSPEVFAGRSDTMLLVRFDPQDKSVRMLSIPRDTRIDDLGLSVPKINQANADGGAALAARVVSKTLNDVPIDRYVRVTADAFQELVDLVGGVEVFVPYPMSYVDVTQNLEIDLQEGWQTLNGEQAEHFVRYRDGNNGDVGRVQRQQALMKALRERVQSPTIITRVPQAVRLMQQYIDTNLSLEEILALVGFSLNLDREDFKMVLLPGRFSRNEEYELSYWLMNQSERDRVMKQYFEQDPTQITWAQRNNRRSQARVRIALQNATDEAGLATRVASYLHDHELDESYDIYFLKDSPRQLSQTEIIVQRGDLEAADLLKKALGFGIVEADSTGDLTSDLTIRIGQDWLEKLDREF